MSDAGSRRAGYSPTDAPVGRRGQHTRRRILRHARRLFATRGFHGTSIDAIASAAGSSRASVYQYFEGKDGIFVELLAECEQAVLEHVRSLGPLSADAHGLAHLYAWLRELAGLYDDYFIVFYELPGIGLDQGVPPSTARAVSDQYIEVMTEKIRAARVVGLDPIDAANVTLRIIHMVNAYRSRAMFGIDQVSSVNQSLAVAVQLLLFPETAAFEFAAFPSATQQAAHAEGSAPCAPVSTLDPDSPSVSPIRQDMLSAASALFARHGYYAVSMDDIAREAGVGRATLYRQFSTKVKILAELSDWAAVEGGQLTSDLRHVHARDGTDALHVWLSRYLHYHRLYGSTIRAWFDGTIAAQLPQNVMQQGQGAFHSAVAGFLADVTLPRGMDPQTAAAIFLAVLGRLSEYVISRGPDETDYDGAALLTLAIRRMLLGSDPRWAGAPES
jgi:AcrR family transcriptional regulator